MTQLIFTYDKNADNILDENEIRELLSVGLIPIPLLTRILKSDAIPRRVPLHTHKFALPPPSPGAPESAGPDGRPAGQAAAGRPAGEEDSGWVLRRLAEIAAGAAHGGYRRTMTSDPRIVSRVRPARGREGGGGGSEPTRTRSARARRSTSHKGVGSWSRPRERGVTGGGGWGGGARLPRAKPHLRALP